jgi:hypothetical protein
VSDRHRLGWKHAQQVLDLVVVRRADEPADDLVLRVLVEVRASEVEHAGVLQMHRVERAR